MGDTKKVTINKEIFLKRIAKLYDYWNNGNDENLSKVDALVFMVGNDDDASQYSKSNALQIWLYNYELNDMLAIFTKNTVYFLASSRKALFFQPVGNEEPTGLVPPVVVFTREKSDKDKANFIKLVEKLKESGSSFGHFAKDSYSSDFAKGWNSIMEEYGIKLTVDVSISFAHLLSEKDDTEVELCRKAAQASVNAWSYARKKIIDIIDQAKKVKHSRFAEDIEKAMTTVQVQQRLADNSNLESCYTPIIQSGGEYILKLSAESNDKLIHYGTIICSLGARYQSYCSNLSRTMLVDPSKELQEAYESLLIIQNAIIEALKPGKKLSEAYAAGLEAAKDKPVILDHLVKNNFGFLTGLEFRESTALISPRSDVEVVPNMVFIVYVGLQGLKNLTAKDEQSKTSAVLLSDTVLISAEGVNEILTEKAKSRIKSNVIRFKDEAETSHADDNKENNLGEGFGRGRRSVLLQEQTRNKTTNEDKRKEHQKELGKRLNEAARERLADQTGQKDIKKIKKSNISYKSYEKFPKEAEVDKLQIYVDRRHDSVILPIFGVPVPFHISMIKNTSQSVEGDYTYLRVNFMHPGSQIGRDQLQFPNPLSTYVKELTYRSSNLKEHGEVTAPSSNLNTAYRLIKEMQKKFRTQEAEEREKEGAVKQDKLILSTAKGNPKLKDLFVRPNIITKRISGSLEAHANGFRYTSLRGDKIDVLYNNIKHAFFQPCDNEMIILIHFTLKNPVLWGKRKYQDIQFYTEVGEITTDLGKYHHMQDRDDVQSEQLEREMRKRLNQVFQNFCDKVVRQTNEAFDFDVPFNELGFFGVPYRSSCTLKPTSSCLVNLSEWPPFVVTLDEVEFVHFERVSFQLKNFDMVFVFKDYSKKTQMVQQIPMTSLDSVKEWLNSCDIYYSEGIQSLNWAKIMKTILDDPEDFFVNGGWNFLATDSDNEDEEEDEESEDAYTPSEDETEGSDEDEDEEESPEATSESESEATMDSDESEGKDWSDLEAEAQRADRARDRGEEERMHKSTQKRKPTKGRGPSPKRRK
ncbi:metallopeptidase family M24 containing protein [Brugia malayi]|uniref:FACT complex subunit n=1 Tax=Brugia malayi TaxID=6279 RepID=A0A4E9FUN8_BRUMA|nr:metallopeptidase family M24 containing protein [Brugia malayi]VIO99589.1 metallopeptidase family M24 containing protein [Brugia malayi]